MITSLDQNSFSFDHETRLIRHYDVLISYVVIAMPTLLHKIKYRMVSSCLEAWKKLRKANDAGNDYPARLQEDNYHITLKGSLGGRYRTPSVPYTLAWLFDEWWYYAEQRRKDRKGDDEGETKVEDPHRRKHAVKIDYETVKPSRANVRELTYPDGIFDVRLNTEIFAEGKRAAIVQQCNCVGGNRPDGLAAEIQNRLPDCDPHRYR